MILLVAPSPSGGGSLPADLVGKWESVNNLGRSHTSLEQQLELRADGSLVSSTVSVMQARYRVAGSNLVTEFTDLDGKVDRQTCVFEIRGDTLRETTSNGHLTEMTRAPAKKQDAAPIVGVWTYSDPEVTAGLSSTTFTADGRMIVRVPVKLESGTWQASGDRLTYSFGKQAPETVGYRRIGNLLTIVSRGKQREFHRPAVLD